MHCLCAVSALRAKNCTHIVIFLPVFQDNRRVPVSLTDVKLNDRELTFTVVPMDPTQRAELLTHLKEPIDFAPLAQ